MAVVQETVSSSDSASNRVIVRRPLMSEGLSGMHPLLHQVFSRRAVSDLDQLDHALVRLLPPGGLLGIDTASRRLLEAIDRSEDILILGDYDADGATASVVAILGLRSLGATTVDYLVPNRFDYGYGLSPEIAAVAIERQPDLVITVDNGIASVEGVATLRQAGIDVIITDHHLAGEVLPDATAIVNPNQPGCGFPGKALAGVGVMFYLLLALRGLMRDEGRFNGASAPNLAQLLDLVALGTVADVVPLDHNNRILVAQGIARIQQRQCRPGILALLEVAEKSPSNASTMDLGFYVAPRLNAAGRLDDISMGIECLLTDDPVEARELAMVLHEFNQERRRIEKKMQNQALEIVDAMARDIDNARPGICLFDSKWHRGITGLVASRVKERFDQPAIVFAPADEDTITGSARSIPGLHIRDMLEAIATASPDLIAKYGGHAMAAGLTLDEGDLDEFRNRFQGAVAAHFERHPPTREIYSDGPLEPEFFTREIADMLRNAAPWGQQFSPPLFDNEFRVLSVKVLGGKHLKLRLALPQRSGKPLEGIVFNYLEEGEAAPTFERIVAAYRLEINEFRGVRNLQLLIEHIDPC